MNKTIYAVERRRPNGEVYWVDLETGQELAAPMQTANLSEALRKGHRVELREPSKRPLTPAELRVKETAKLLNLSEAEAEIFARGRE